MTKKQIVLFSIILAGALSRLIPHPYNFTAIGSIALFGGALIGSKSLKFILPLMALVISDVVLELTAGIGFHSTIPFVYGAFLLTTLLGSKLIGRNYSISKILGGAVGASLLFFLLTNFGVWLTSAMYTKDLAGLVTCYTAALPFYSQDPLSSFALNGLLSNVFFSTILFGLHALATKVRWIPSRA